MDRFSTVILWLKSISMVRQHSFDFPLNGIRSVFLNPKTGIVDGWIYKCAVQWFCVAWFCGIHNLFSSDIDHIRHFLDFPNFTIRKCRTDSLQHFTGYYRLLFLYSCYQRVAHSFDFYFRSHNNARCFSHSCDGALN